MSVPRSELYEQVWAEPMTTVAKRYGVSSNYLARICERPRVPRPARGYWAKLKAGRSAKRQKLPQAEPGQEIEWNRRGNAAREPHRPIPPKRGTTGAGQQPRPRRHTLLAGAKEYFANCMPPRKYNDSGYIRPRKRHVPDIYVTKDTIGRALDLARRLFCSLEGRGHHVDYAPADREYWRRGIDVAERAKNSDRYASEWSPMRPTVVFVGTVALGLTVFELTEEAEVRYLDGQYVRVGRKRPLASKLARPWSSGDWTHTRDMPSGRLALRAYSPYRSADWEKQWRERKRGELKGRVDEIVVELEDAAGTVAKLVEKARLEAEERERQWEIQRRELEKREAERRAQELEAQREKNIREVIERWRFARDVRAYVAEIKDMVETAGLAISEGSDLEWQLEWSLRHADSVDPLDKLRREITRLTDERASAGADLADESPSDPPPEHSV